MLSIRDIFDDNLLVMAIIYKSFEDNKR